MTEKELVKKLRLEIQEVSINQWVLDNITQRILPVIKAYAEQSTTSAFLAGVRERDKEWKKALAGWKRGTGNKRRVTKNENETESWADAPSNETRRSDSRPR